jgi:RHS repeat-associated protein
MPISRHNVLSIAPLVLALRVAIAALLLSSHLACRQTGSAATARWQTERTTFVHQGLAAGPVLLTREDGTIVEERRFEPFGAALDALEEPRGGGAGVIGPVDFTTFDLGHLNKRVEPSTAWSYHGARWVAPSAARWLSPDPPAKGPDERFLGKPWALHPYQYVLQNPTQFWDPDGRDEAIMPASLAWSVCAETWSTTESYPVGPYELHPFYSGDRASPQLEGYVAYDPKRREADWVVRPDAVPAFFKQVDLYQTVAMTSGGYPDTEAGRAAWSFTRNMWAGNHAAAFQNAVAYQSAMALDPKQQLLGLFGVLAGGPRGPIAARVVALDANAFRSLLTLRMKGLVSASDHLVITPNVVRELANHGITSAAVKSQGVTVLSEAVPGAATAATRIGDVLRGLGGPGARSASDDALNLAEAAAIAADAFITFDRQILRAFGGRSTIPGTGGTTLDVGGL